jgi:hypothetical protein
MSYPTAFKRDPETGVRKEVQPAFALGKGTFAASYRTGGCVFLTSARRSSAKRLSTGWWRDSRM